MRFFTFQSPHRWRELRRAVTTLRRLAIAVPVGMATTILAAAPVRAQAPAVSPRDIADSLLSGLLPPSLRARVLATAPELSVRRAELLAAQARRDAAGFAPPASLSVETEDARNGRFDRANTSLVLSRDFLSTARRRGERAVADAGVQAARVALAASERRILAETARALYAVGGWRAIVQRLGAQDSLLMSAEGSVRARFAVGDARYVDVLRLRTERLRVQSDRAMAETEIEAAVIALVTLSGGDSAAMRTAAEAVDSLDRDATGRGALLTVAARLPEAPVLDSLVAIAAEVRLADARIAQAEAQRRLLVARQRPALSASVGVQRMGADAETGPGFGPILAVGMSLPFTAGRANRAALAAAEQQTAATMVGRRAAALGVRGALAAARARYEAARRRAASFDTALLRAAREERESALATYRTADLSLLELLDFERALSRAEIERTRASLDALAALAELLSGAPSSAIMSTATAESGTSRVPE